MATMRVVTQRSFGGPEVLEIGEAERPEPIPTEVLVKIEAAGVNRVDAKTRAGQGMAPVLGEPPFVLGWDAAGTVVATGRGVTRFEVGDVVFGMPRFPREAGCYAEYVAAPSRQFALAPSALSFTEAAALPLCGLTAWQALVDTADVVAGQRVLVHAAAGGVGHLAVQLAKSRGAWVAGTGGPDREDFVRRLGADEFLDYTAGPFEDAIGDIDVVVDLVGGETSSRSLDVLVRDGLLISVPSRLPEGLVEQAAKRDLRVTGLLVEPDHRGLDCLAELVEEGALRVWVSQSFPLAQAGEAHAAIEDGHSQGKTVLVVG